MPRPGGSPPSTPEFPVLTTLPTRRMLLAVALPLLIALLSSPVAAQGRIDVLNNRGEVTPLSDTHLVSETLDEVRYRRGNSDRTETRRAEQVVEIVYGPGSDTYQQGLAALAARDLLQAANLLTAAADEKEPSWQAPIALLRLAEAQAARGTSHIPAARATLDRFVQQHGEHRRLPEVLIERGRLAQASGESGAMEQAVSAVKQLVGQKRAPATWSVRAQIELGHVRLAAGQAVEARGAYQAAVSDAEGSRLDLSSRVDLLAELDRMVLDARSGTGSALLAAGDLGGARVYFQQLQKDGADDKAVQVAALNGLAQADFEEGGGDRLKSAQLGFARASVLGAGAPEQHAKALYFLGRCSLALADANRAKRAAAKNKAQHYSRIVQSRYPETRWARLARESLP